MIFLRRSFGRTAGSLPFALLWSHFSALTFQLLIHFKNFLAGILTKKPAAYGMRRARRGIENHMGLLFVLRFGQRLFRPVGLVIKKIAARRPFQKNALEGSLNRFPHHFFGERNTLFGFHLNTCFFYILLLSLSNQQ